MPNDVVASEMSGKRFRIVFSFAGEKRDFVDRLEGIAYALAVENGYDQSDRFRVLDEVWPTVAAALPRFLVGLNDQLQTVCDALADFLIFTGRWDECLSLRQQAERKAAAAADYLSAGWRAYNAGWIYYPREEADLVGACADRAEAHWRKSEAGVSGRATALRLRGLGLELKHDYRAAIAAHEESLTLRQSLSADTTEVASSLNDLVDTERHAGDLKEAELHYREALRISLTLGYDQGVAAYTGNLAILALEREDWQQAESLAQEALLLTEKLGRVELIAESCETLALALVGQAKGVQGLPYALRSVELYIRLGSPNIERARGVLRACED